jgi:hypothetical protein
VFRTCCHPATISCLRGLVVIEKTITVPDVFLWKAQGNEYLLQLATRAARAVVQDADFLTIDEPDLEKWFDLCDSHGLSLRLMGSARCL